MTTKTAPGRGAEAPTNPARAKRAFAYVRVSSDAQTNTGFGRDGLSISSQTEAAHDRADQLDAELVRVWSDPGKSAYVDLHKRVEFLEMLDEIKRLNLDPDTRIDYIIVWSLSRWSRNVQDHHRTVELVKKAGARIVSPADTGTLTKRQLHGNLLFRYENMILNSERRQARCEAGPLHLPVPATRHAPLWARTPRTVSTSSP